MRQFLMAPLLGLLVLAGCATFLDGLYGRDRANMDVLKLYNRSAVRDLTIRGGGHRLHKPDPGTGGQAVTPDAFPSDTQALHVSWTNPSTGERIVHERVPIKPWQGAVDEFGLEIEFVIDVDGSVAARRRPFAGELKEDEYRLRPSVRPPDAVPPPHLRRQHGAPVTQPAEEAKGWRWWPWSNGN